MKQNLTKKFIEGLKARSERYSVYDTQVRGLGVLVLPTGHKSFFWYRKVQGRPTWKTIGEFPALSIERARGRAQENNTKLTDWKSKDYREESPFVRRANATLGDVLEDYIDRHVKSNAKNPDRAAKMTRWQFDKYLHGWKSRRLSNVTRADVLKLHKHYREKVSDFTANRTVQLLRALFNWAIRELDFRGSNPAVIKLVNEKRLRRTRYLLPQEAKQFLEALTVEPQRDLQDFIVLALFTGARAGDIMAMRWQDITFETTTWRVPNPKSSIPYIVPLLPEAIERLKSRREATAPGIAWVFPSHGQTGHIVNFGRSWREFKKRAKLADLRIHDLRRTLGSWMATGGSSLLMIGSALGHQSMGATDRYAELQREAVRQQMSNATRALLEAGKEKKGR